MRETEVVFPYMRCWPFSSARAGSDIIGGHYGGERVSRRVSTLVQPLHLHQTSSVLLDICTLDTHFILYLHARKRLSFCRIFDNTKFRIFSSNCIDCTLCLYLHCRTFRRHTWAFVQRTPRHVSIAGNLVAVWSGHHHPSLSTTYIFCCKRNFSIFKEMKNFGYDIILAPRPACCSYSIVIWVVGGKIAQSSFDFHFASVGGQKKWEAKRIKWPDTAKWKKLAL